MRISAKIVADSENEFGNRITTMLVTFPRIILAEFNTHRMFSRNSASSRAIPFEKMVKSVEENPFIPIAWQKDHKGMQGNEYITNVNHLKQCEEDWLKARDNAIGIAKELSSGFPVLDKQFKQVEKEREDYVTKQLCNRLLEPFMWHTVLITATEWENFFTLRCPKYDGFVSNNKIVSFKSRKDVKKHFANINIPYPNVDDSFESFAKINTSQAEIHIQALAEAMWDAKNESTPKQLRAGEWHTPFGGTFDKKNIDTFAWITNKERNLSPIQTEIAIATAMCARVSYTVVGKEDKASNYANDIILHDKLLALGHASPFEHCAQCMSAEEYKSNYTVENGETTYGVSRNFIGFKQYRAMLGI